MSQVVHLCSPFLLNVNTLMLTISSNYCYYNYVTSCGLVNFQNCKHFYTVRKGQQYHAESTETKNNIKFTE